MIIAASLPELPAKKIERYTSQMGLSEYDAILLSSEKEVAIYFDELCTLTTLYKAAANWVIGPVRSYLHESTARHISDFPISAKVLSELIGMVDSGKLNYSIAAHQVFPELIKNPGRSATETANSLQVIIDTDEDELTQLIEDILNNYPDKVKDYQNGKKGVLGLFMGDLMKVSKGKINPQTASKLIINKLESKT